MNWYLPRNAPPPPMACGLPPDSQAAIACSVPETAGAAAASRLSWRLSWIRPGVQVAQPAVAHALHRAVGRRLAAELAHGVGEPQVAAHEDTVPGVVQLSADGLAGDRGMQQRVRVRLGARRGGERARKRGRGNGRSGLHGFNHVLGHARTETCVPVGFRGLQAAAEELARGRPGVPGRSWRHTLAEHVFA